MTNHIEQLMKAAGVVPVHLTDCSFINIRKGYDVGTDCCPAVEDERLKCEDCEYSKETQLIYPAFTSAKQVELIKLIVDKCQEIKIYKNKCMDSFLFQAQENWGEYEYKANVENFGSCLATLILELLKNNKLDKSEVKRILEDD